MWGEETTQGNEYYEESITEDILESGYHERISIKRDCQPSTHFRAFWMKYGI